MNPSNSRKVAQIDTGLGAVMISKRELLGKFYIEGQAAAGPDL
jgi:hypothetical protein